MKKSAKKLNQMVKALINKQIKAREKMKKWTGCTDGLELKMFKDLFKIRPWGAGSEAGAEN